MNGVREKLELITEFWNNYVWKFAIIRKKILWNDEVKTNYYGDILNYFIDTFDLIKINFEKSNCENNIFYTIGLMQIIYIHQDLIDELLRIFKLSKSTKHDKNPNREIRNELIGHPISKYKNSSLKSSIFWEIELSRDTLHYIKYSQNNDFKEESKTYKIVDIIRSHEKYLNKYFDIILERIENILKEYNKQISRLEKMINNNKDFENIVILTSQIYENIFQQEYLYSPKILIECKKREKEHERYKYAVNHFLIDLKLGIQETKSDIFNYNTKIIGKKEGNKISHEICVVFTDSGKEDIKIHEQKNYNYIMEKLYSKQIKYDFSYIENKFKDYPNMLEEINNMKININNDLEYYASYNYLRSLLTKEKLLKD